MISRWWLLVSEHVFHDPCWKAVAAVQHATALRIRKSTTVRLLPDGDSGQIRIVIISYRDRYRYFVAAVADMVIRDRVDFSMDDAD